MGTAPNRGALAIAGGFADVLRLGNELTFDSAGGFAKGVALNVLRVLSVAQPLTAHPKNEFRYKRGKSLCR